MKLLAWSVNNGDNDIQDYYIVCDDLEEAKAQAFDIIFKTKNLHCWAISDIIHASEAHWTEDKV